MDVHPEEEAGELLWVAHVLDYVGFTGNIGDARKDVRHMSDEQVGCERTSDPNLLDVTLRHVERGHALAMVVDECQPQL